MGKRGKPSVLVCYLCGEPLHGRLDDDHVPAKQFFPKELRPTLKPLLKLRTHAACNNSWKLHEEYFVNTLQPLSRGTPSGNALHADFVRRLSQGRGLPLAKRVLAEFSDRVGKVWLPANRTAKRIDAYRAHDVLWKIVRGLHFHHTRRVWPSRWTMALTFTPPGEPIPEFFRDYALLERRQPEGENQHVFAYVRDEFKDDDSHFHFWAFRLWEAIVITAIFHDPDCTCEHCSFIGPRLPEQLHNTVRET